VAVHATTETDDLALSAHDVRARREATEPAQRVIFRVAGLYGLSRESVRLPVSRREAIESGPSCLTLDPEGDPSGNVGLMDFDAGMVRVRYNVHGVFSGLHELVKSGNHDLSLLRPVRAVATDECTLTGDLKGWRALGCLDFLPGSLWAGASGG
jgi:hypothetical protein